MEQERRKMAGSEWLPRQLVLVNICEFPYKSLNLFAGGFGDWLCVGGDGLGRGCEEVEGREMLFLIVS